MAKDSPFDMFHEGAKKKDSSSDETASPTPQIPTYSKPTRNIAIEAMIERMNQMRQEIDNKINDMAYQHGISKENLQKFLSDPKNFTPEQWKFLQIKSQDFIQKMDVANEAQPGDGAASLTARKGKFIGLRRKWIPTR
ncbi:MAG: hypothetical protein H0T62_01175 [Parachlamydiaceae bacterium]|nr:hypothetical protein [Parachlamydiaceae bacterium]